MTPEGPLFLVGAQRSGTTALAAALQSAFAREGGLFTVNGKLLYLLERWVRDVDIRARHLRADEILHSLRRVRPLGDAVDSWLARVELAVNGAAKEVAAGRWGFQDEDRTALIRQIVDESYGVPLWGEKYNETMLQLGFVDRVCPSARWLFVYRDPAEVTSSMLDWGPEKTWRPDTRRDCESKWVAWNTPWLDFRSNLGPGRSIEIDYAHLCDGSARAEVQRFVGMDIESELRQLGRRTTRDRVPVLSDAARDVFRQLADRQRA